MKIILKAFAALLLAGSLGLAATPAAFAREPQGAATPAKASPGTEVAVKKLLADLASGNPDYSIMDARMAEVTKAQLPQLHARMVELGAIKSIVFKEVGPQGGDNFDVTFANGALRFIVKLDAQGKVSNAGMRPLQ